MILRRTIDLPGGTTATLRELTVYDFRRLLDSEAALEPEIVLAICPDAILVSGSLADLDAGQVDEIWRRFRDLNREMLPHGKGKPSGPLRRKHSAQKLDENCLALIELGHTHIWDYPYRLYCLAVEGKWRNQSS